MDFNEKLLLEKARKGDIDAFEKLVKNHYQRLFHFALGITGGNDATASDILQEALIKAYLNIARFEGKSSFTSWLWRILKNEFFNYMRNNDLSETTSFEDISEPAADVLSMPDESFFDHELKRNLMNLIDRMPEIHREIIIMAELMGMSLNEISLYLDIPEGSVKSRLSRAREKLTELVNKNMELFA